ncbi:UDP-glucose 6-dehydrogenase tuaD [[Clostridium] ultunense Esp]|nr:UDP-glucose 6-dehydrogenase tuaD [[Clostridium] ultunense Esp]
MKILIIGTGYVGTATALALAHMGWSVTGLDKEDRIITLLNSGHLPFFEPDMEEFLQKQLGKGNLRFTTKAEEAIQNQEVIFICVGTPAKEDGSADLGYVKMAAETVARYMRNYTLIVNKSTSPIGTQEKIVRWIRDAQPKKGAVPFDVVSNPEFLREGSALRDVLQPDRIVIGSDSHRATAILRHLYQSMKCPMLVTTPRTAEMIKYAANSFLAVKISFINELARLCDKVEVDVKDVASGIGLDPRVGGSFLQAGIGYGGSCFPKDVEALLHTARSYHGQLSILERAAAVNRQQQVYALKQLKKIIGSFQGKTVAVFGISFKPGTDDLRESPSLHLIRRLLQKGASVAVHDPVARLPQELGDEGVKQYETPERAAEGADAIMINTDWPDYRRIDWKKIGEVMREPVLFDGRNMFDKGLIIEAGFQYRGIGR